MYWQTNMTDRFDLEQHIMECWNVTKDIQLLRETISDKIVTQDFQENFLLGLETIYEAKFEKLWETFERCIKAKDI